MTRTRKVIKKKRSASIAKVPALDIKSASDVKKALDIMKNHPLTIVLVFANWCPHCHTFMSRWNKLKGIPNRTSPMISVENEFSDQLLSNMSDETGKPPRIDGYPTVLANTNRGNRNVGMQVSTASDEALRKLATNAHVMGVENENNSSNMNTNTENNGSNMNTNNENNDSNMNTNNENNGSNMNTNNENNGSNMNTNTENNDELAASYFSESAEKKNKGSIRSIAPSGRRVRKLSAILENAVENASSRASASVREAKRLRGKADEELSFPRSGYASPPPAENSTMNGGSCGANGSCGVPSGLIRLQGGSQQPTLYSLLNGLKSTDTFNEPSSSRKETRRRNRKQRK